jgi:hypothetical protein
MRPIDKKPDKVKAFKAVAVRKATKKAPKKATKRATKKAPEEIGGVPESKRVLANLSSHKKTPYDKLTKKDREALDKKIEGFIDTPFISGSRPLISGLRRHIETLTQLVTGDIQEQIKEGIGGPDQDANPRRLIKSADALYKAWDSAKRAYESRSYITQITRPERRREYAKQECIGLYNYYKKNVWFNEAGPYGNEWIVAVKMGPVNLRNLRFGNFIVGLARLYPGEIRAVPTKPLWAAPSEKVRAGSLCHPHVRDGVLCLGEVGNQVFDFLWSGRVMDAMSLVEPVIMTYTANGAYKPIGRWNEGPKTEKCALCKDTARSAEMKSCHLPSCKGRVCVRCWEERSCNSCARVACSKHLTHCTLCGVECCFYCNESAPGGAKHGFGGGEGLPICSNCWEQLPIGGRRELSRARDLNGAKEALAAVLTRVEEGLRFDLGTLQKNLCKLKKAM